MNYFIAHRGLHSQDVKENSLLAFKKSLESNEFDGFECDVRTSKDEILVVNHNSFVGTHLVSKTNYQVLHQKYGIDRLETVLKLRSPKIFLLEIKEKDVNIPLLVSILNKYSSKNIYVMSFYKKVIHLLKRENVKCKLGVLNTVLNSEDSYEDYDFIGLLEVVATKKLVSYFQRKGILVFFYGVHEMRKSNQVYDNIYFICDKKVI
ncbi:MAG: glycerophosphodiester phosphodiesterase [Bacilli bacterium]|nr:glycerophosphodiester phosphodiesterase [Bacilli bacterium]